MSESDKISANQSRERVRDTQKWKKVETKRKRDSGIAYISRSTQKCVPARQMGLPCSCASKCFEKVGLENAKNIFKDFWEMGNYNAQTLYLYNRLSVFNVKRSLVKDGKSRRSNSITYTVMVNGEVFKVCLNAFLNMHGISEKRVRNALKKGTDFGTVIEDQRGKHKPSNKTRGEVKDFIRTHIQNVLLYASQYPRSKSPRAYLLPGLSIRALYRDYLVYLETENKEHLKASEYVYSTIFKTEFNVDVEPTESDTYNFFDSKVIQCRILSKQHFLLE